MLASVGGMESTLMLARGREKMFSSRRDTVTSSGVVRTARELTIEASKNASAQSLSPSGNKYRF